jgi:DNA invertase Pin-like site-specific DNA recombinase
MWNERIAKLTPVDREKAKTLRDDGMKMATIAKRFGCSIATISRALDEKREPATPAAKR